MAGAYVTVNDREVRQALRKLERRAGNLREAFQDIGESLKISYRERFERQEAPSGEPWAPLSEEYRRRKRKNRDRILMLEGYLADMPRYRTTPDELEFGTNRIYGATHQFGDPSRGIPARPFLGLSDDDEQMVLEILEEFLQER